MNKQNETQSEQWRRLNREAEAKLKKLSNACQRYSGYLECLYDIVDIPAAVRCTECGQVYDLDGKEDNTRPIIDPI